MNASSDLDARPAARQGARLRGRRTKYIPGMVYNCLHAYVNAESHRNGITGVIGLNSNMHAMRPRETHRSKHRQPSDRAMGCTDLKNKTIPNIIATKPQQHIDKMGSSVVFSTQRVGHCRVGFCVQSG